MKYRYEGKEKLISLGTCPDLCLREARAKRDDTRIQLRDGVDPAANRKAARAADSGDIADCFEVIAREWLTKNADGWTEEHADRIRRRLERDVFPWLGKRPVAEITTPELLKVLERIQDRGAIDTAHRAQQNCMGSEAPPNDLPDMTE